MRRLFVSSVWFLLLCSPVFSQSPILHYTFDEGADGMAIDQGTGDAANGEFLDGVTYDGTQPNAYLDSLTIGLKTDSKI